MSTPTAEASIFLVMERNSDLSSCLPPENRKASSHDRCLHVIFLGSDRLISTFLGVVQEIRHRRLLSLVVGSIMKIIEDP